MKQLAILTLILNLTSCSLSKLESNISDKRTDGFASETLIRYSSDRIEKLYDSKDPKMVALAKCHNNIIRVGLKKLKKIYKTHKKDHDYWNKVGTCYYLGSNLNKAEFYFNHSLEISKASKVKNPNAYNNLGVIFLKNRHYDNAFKMFQKAQKESPKLLTPDYNIAQLNIEFGHVDKAHETLKVLLTHSPKDVDIIASMATVMLIKKNYASSKKFFEQIDEDNIRRGDISNHYALVLYNLKQYIPARDVLKNQKVSTVKAVIDMRKHLTKVVSEAIEKQKQKKLAARKTN